MKLLSPAPEGIIDLEDRIVSMDSMSDELLIVWTESACWEVGMWPTTYAIRIDCPPTTGRQQ